jgi:hypothetical protein
MELPLSSDTSNDFYVPKNVVTFDTTPRYENVLEIDTSKIAINVASNMLEVPPMKKLLQDTEDDRNLRTAQANKIINLLTDLNIKLETLLDVLAGRVPLRG